MAQPRIGNLIVQANGAEIPPTSTRYRIIEAAADLAICLLETPDGKRSLATLADRILTERMKVKTSLSRRPFHIYQDSLDNMPYWIERFLQSFRSDFPVVSLVYGADSESSTVRYEWGLDMRQFVASEAGVVCLDAKLVDNISNAQQQPPAISLPCYNIFKFQVAIIIAHEMCHFLTGFLTGKTYPDTPTKVVARPYDNEAVFGRGEAGRYWENILIGGFVEFWSSPTHPLGDRQPGRPYLFLEGTMSTGVGRPVCPSYITEFLNHRKF